MKIMPDMKPFHFPASIADDMVRALLDNRKTVTRRVVKPKYCNSVFEVFRRRLCEVRLDTPPIDNDNGATTHFVTNYIPCKPPYLPGDILYVREGWAPGTDVFDRENQFVYKADYDGHVIPLWHPSIHMPREAARIFLRVTNVSVAKLRDITDSDIEREGIQSKRPEFLRIDFADLWNSTLKAADLAIYGWDANPYVFVISFERISKEEAERT